MYIWIDGYITSWAGWHGLLRGSPVWKDIGFTDLQETQGIKIDMFHITYIEFQVFHRVITCWIWQLRNTPGHTHRECGAHKPPGWETALAVEHVLKKKGLGAVVPCIFLINITINFAGQNQVILKGSHGIYKVLWVWDDGRFSLLV